jgi:hypothetical protein
MLSFQSQCFIYSFIRISPTPHLRSSSTKQGKICGQCPRRRAGRRSTYDGVRPGSPRGWLTPLLSLNQCHADFSTIPSTVAWVDQSPVSQPLPPPHVTEGTDQRNPEVRRRGRIYGRQRNKDLTRDTLIEILKKG